MERDRWLRAIDLAIELRLPPPESRYSPDQPRVPAGSPGGGEFGQGGGDNSSSEKDKETKTPEATLTSAVKLYTSTYQGAFIVSRVSALIIQGKSQEEIGKFIAGESNTQKDSAEAAARTLLNAIRNEPEESSSPLYRAVSFDKEIYNYQTHQIEPNSDPLLGQLRSAKVGDTITLGQISSFSSDRKISAGAIKNSVSKENYEIRLEGPSKSLSTDELGGLGQKERVTTGTFKVVGVETSSSVTPIKGLNKSATKYHSTIVLRQEGVF